MQALHKTHLYEFKRIHSFVNQLLNSSIGFAADLSDHAPRAFCVKHMGLIENAVFVDFYKSHVMLQAVMLIRAHKKHDSLIAMLCTLFLKYPRFDEELSVLQSIARKRYVMVAEYILKRCTSVKEIDRRATISA